MTSQSEHGPALSVSSQLVLARALRCAPAPSGCESGAKVATAETVDEKVDGGVESNHYVTDVRHVSPLLL